MMTWDPDKFSGEPSPGTRRWKQLQRDNARGGELFDRFVVKGETRSSVPVAASDEASRAYIDAVADPANRLVLIKCRNCGETLEVALRVGAHLMLNRRTVLAPDDNKAVALHCLRCDTAAVVDPARIRDAAAQSVIEGRTLSMRVGHRHLE